MANENGEERNEARKKDSRGEKEKEEEGKRQGRGRREEGMQGKKTLTLSLRLTSRCLRTATAFLIRCQRSSGMLGARP